MYRKALRKPPEAYTATTPPHVAAARKIAGQRRGRIAYVMTTPGARARRGAARARSTTSTTSSSQLRAVAEPVLTLLGQDFDDASGARKQLMLF